MRIAGWSGPRNLSTAMMYAFAARGDCRVVDEPFYAAYLHQTGLDHPMRDEILASQPTDPAEVERAIAAPERGHLYLKLMAHHVIDGIPPDWAADCAHLHLIRHPARVIASYAAKREHPTLDDIGYPAQAMLYHRFGGVVVDSADLRGAPGPMLHAACAALGVDYTREMLSWPEGGHPSDGVWASHWYAAVHRSTGFAGPEGPLPVLEGKAAKLLKHALPLYEAMARDRLTV